MQCRKEPRRPTRAATKPSLAGPSCPRDAPHRQPLRRGADTAICKLVQVDGDSVSPASWCDSGSTPSITTNVDYDALGRPATVTQSATCASDADGCGDRLLVMTNFVYASNGRPKSYDFRLTCSRSGESHSGSVQLTRNAIGQVDSYHLQVDGATCS